MALSGVDLTSGKLFSFCIIAHPSSTTHLCKQSFLQLLTATFTPYRSLQNMCRACLNDRVRGSDGITPGQHSGKLIFNSALDVNLLKTQNQHFLLLSDAMRLWTLPLSCRCIVQHDEWGRATAKVWAAMPQIRTDRRKARIF